jgi:1-aminocyclopropane-1-carboxylate deaminase/D-cysteine desulfhydrase-like pyridoxal-dependent ACC family enzyme
MLLDPFVTIRAFRGLLDVVGRDAKTLGQRVCFIHSGGPFSLFPLRDRLSGLLDHI